MRELYTILVDRGEKKHDSPEIPGKKQDMSHGL